MHRIDNSTAVTVMPIRKPAGTEGFFTQGNQTSGQLATIVEADILNALMMEIANVVTRAGIALNKLDDTQLWAAINALINASRLGFMPVEQGGGYLQGSNKVRIGWATDGSGLKAQVDATDLGPIAFLQRAQTFTATQSFQTVNVTTINGGTFSGSSIYSSGAMTAAGTVTGGTVNSNGNMTASGGMYAGYIASTGNINAAGTFTGGAVSVTGGVNGNGQVRGGSIMSAGGIFYVADNLAYYVGRGGDGAWRFVENGNVTCTIDGAGNLTSAGAIACTYLTSHGGGSFAGDVWSGGALTSTGNTNVGNSIVIQHDVIFANATNPGRSSLFGNGDLGSLILNVSGGGECAIRGYRSAGETQVIANGVIGLRIVNNGDAYFIANVFGAAFNPSDTRIKEQSAPYTRGLADVLRMTPKAYKLKRDLDGPLHVSIDAQALLETIPEAVVERDCTEQDGLADQLFIQPDFVNYAMLNAIKEMAATIDTLTARVAALEGAR
jgi:hypothetical protein